MFYHINFILIYDLLILVISFIGGFYIGKFIGDLIFSGDLIKFAAKKFKKLIFSAFK